MNAGKTNNYFKLERHTKQRDPVSEFLFIHKIYFFFSLEQNKDIKGIELFQENLYIEPMQIIGWYSQRV